LGIEYQQKKSNNFAAITCFFNFGKSELRETAYSRFSEGLKRQGVELFTIELIYGENKPFIKPNSNCIHMRAGSVLWSKENILNILVKKLPKRIEKIAWVDGDILFSNDDWAKETSDKLNKKKILHLCDTIERTDKHGEVLEYRMSIVKGLLRNHKSFLGPQLDPWADLGGKNGYHPGMAWAANRSFFEEVGLFEYDIAGGGDTTMFLCFITGKAQSVGPSASGLYRDGHHRSWHGKLRSYNRIAFDHVGRNVGYVRGDITHIWHGDGKKKLYGPRHKLCSDVDFDADLKKDEQGLLVWARGGAHEEKFKKLMIESGQ